MMPWRAGALAAWQPVLVWVFELGCKNAVCNPCCRQAGAEAYSPQRIVFVSNAPAKRITWYAATNCQEDAQSGGHGSARSLFRGTIAEGLARQKKIGDRHAATDLAAPQGRHHL